MTEQKTSRRLIIGLIATAGASLAGGAGLAAYAPNAVKNVLQAIRSRFQGTPSNSLPREPDGIVVHHSATKPSRQRFVTVESIDREHQARGLGAVFEGKVYHIAYHYLIMPDGKVLPGRPELCRGGHTRLWRYNRWVGICLVGYFDPQWRHKKHRRPTKKQMDALIELSASLMDKYNFGVTHVLPHRMINPTECPGKSFPWTEYKTRLKHARVNKDKNHVRRQVDSEESG